MFRATPMMHVSAVILERDERKVLESLGSLGAVQLTRAQQDGEIPFTTRDINQEIVRYDRLRLRIEEVVRLLEIPSAGEIELPEPMAIDEIESRLQIMEGDLTELLDLRRAYRQRQRELVVLCQQVEGYRGLDIPLDDADSFSFLHFVTGTIPAERIEDVRTQFGSETALVTLPEQKGRYPVIAMTTRAKFPKLDDALQKAGFLKDILPVQAGETVDSLCLEKESERSRLDEELMRLGSRIRQLAEEFSPELNRMESKISAELGIMRAQQSLGRTDAATVISGWVPGHKSADVTETLKAVTGGHCVVEMLEPGKTDDVPTLLDHSTLMRPFGMLMSSYGIPNYREFEPTLFVAISYVLMFGIMFGDAGQGAVLAGLGIAAFLRGKTEKVRDVGVLLISCGSSSIVFGIIYGSVFGLEYFKHYALWHDPLEGDPMGLMYGAIAVGIIMISLGLILNVINRFRQGDVIGGFFDKFGIAGILFYWGVLAMIIFPKFFEARGLMTAAMIVFLGVPILAWIIKEPLEYFLHPAHGNEGEHTFTSAITESFVGAFEGCLSYLANTISFVRLGAYAMSHAALLVAAFMLAEQVKHIAGGTVWNVIVIILGNLVAIVLEGIIASVQAARLEYYEFFGKFFSGNGQAFEPFRLTGKTKA
ncbi:MAG: H+-ATPase subunit [Deltaproteobacteria bacterium]|nr:H+-ATPase subunit [Deltaproteobacteria bacterium]